MSYIDDKRCTENSVRKNAAPSRSNNYNYNTRSNNSPNRFASSTPTITKARPLPANYIDVAEQFWCSFSPSNISGTKLRNILSLLMDVYYDESARTEPLLTSKSINRLQLARIRMIYESGRKDGFQIRWFLEKSELISYLKSIDTSREKAIDYIHYVEALVAYHKYFGGRD